MIERAATLSPCGKYRYRLERRWDPALPPMVFVMLNPSTADAAQDDPTIRRCIGFGERMGAGRIIVVNLYAYRATDPADLARAAWDAGPENAAHVTAAILETVQAGGRVILAWGRNAERSHRPVQRELRAWLAEQGITPYALRLMSDGCPCHPLMLPYGLEPVPMDPVEPMP